MKINYRDFQSVLDVQIWLLVLEDVKMQIRRAPIVKFMDLTGILNFWFEPDFPENNSFWTKQIRCQTQIEISLVNEYPDVPLWLKTATHCC